MPKYKKPRRYKKTRYQRKKQKKSGVLHSNPLPFPEGQIEVAKHLYIKHDLGPWELGEILGISTKLIQRTEAKATTKQPLFTSSYIISHWVSKQGHPSIDLFVSKFKDQVVKKSVEEFCESLPGQLTVQFPNCSKGKYMELQIGQDGKLFSICCICGLPKGEQNWCTFEDLSAVAKVPTSRKRKTPPEKSGTSSKKAKISSELKWLQAHVKHIQIAFSTDPSSMADALFSEDMISDESRNEILELNETTMKKARRLYAKVERRIDSCPRNFFKFYRVLSEQNSGIYRDLVQKIPNELINDDDESEENLESDDCSTGGEKEDERSQAAVQKLRRCKD